jgi:uncharacterized OsmC-like protein
MKTILTLALFSSLSVMAAPATQKKTLPVNKDEVAVKNEKLKMLDKKLEDCDEKAKKPVEITPQAISLSGNAGCSLDDVKH